jgi:hypothetical protein
LAGREKFSINIDSNKSRRMEGKGKYREKTSN